MAEGRLETGPDGRPSDATCTPAAAVAVGGDHHACVARGARLAAVTYMFLFVLAGAALPTPLYPVYVQRLTLTPLDVTLIFSTYAVAFLVTILLLGRLSDAVGRRRICVAAVVLSGVSDLVFAASDQLPALYAGRVVSGVSVGLVVGAGTAWITEIARGRPYGTVLASLANLGGVGLGALFAGLVSTWFSSPVRTPFVAHLVFLVPALLVLTVAETRAGWTDWRSGLRVQGVSVPAGMRAVFVAAVLASAAAFSLLGFVTSLITDVLADGLGDRSRITAGTSAFVLLACAAFAQVFLHRLGRHAMAIALVLLPAAAGVVVLALVSRSLPVLELALVVGGVGLGIAFRSGLADVSSAAPDERRGEVVSAFFLATYAGLTVPVILAGLLITTTTLLTATSALAAYVAVAALAAGLLRR